MKMKQTLNAEEVGLFKVNSLFVFLFIFVYF